MIDEFAVIIVNPPPDAKSKSIVLSWLKEPAPDKPSPAIISVSTISCNAPRTLLAARPLTESVVSTKAILTILTAGIV